jgi:hypothetical protein
MGWKVAIAIVFTAALGLPTPAAAGLECVAAPTGFDAVREGDLIHLTWDPQVDCPDDGVFHIYRNGALVAETNETSYVEDLTLPVAYMVAWQSSTSQDPSIPSSLVLLPRQPDFRPHIQVAGVEEFVQYMAALAPCPPVVWGDQPDIPYFFDIAWSCLPLDHLRVIFI